MPTLLMDVSKEMHFRLAPVDGTPQLLAGTPAATRRGIEDTHGPIVGHQDVHAFGHVIIVVAREGVATARGPTSTPDLETQHFHQVMVQDLGICNLLLEVVGAFGRRIRQGPTVQAPIGVPIVMVARNQQHLPVFSLQGSQPLIEVAHFSITANRGNITGMDENVGLWEITKGMMQTMSITHMQDGHGVSISTQFQTSGGIGSIG
mmetsp:Transcript_13702/g.16884  ORF Transcript_13702/g.16884 Transcript_13702/m.16884 type:complete len:205 (-) Transcript_13702:106-720(-)